MENTVIFEANSNFSVPTAIVDKFLDAPETALRLILFLLRNTNNSFTKDDIMKKISADEKDTEAAFEYWVKKGVLFKMNGKYVLERPRVTASDAIKYSADRVSERMNEDNEIFMLIKQTEDALKKPVTPETASTVLSLVDFVGLPPEVAMLLVRYCADEKESLRGITNLGIEWKEKGITTFEKADKQLKELKEKKEVENSVANLLGISGRKLLSDEKNSFIKWVNVFGFSKEIIFFAYEKTVKNTGKYQIGYMDRILTAWKEAGYKTLDEIKENSDKLPTKPSAKTKKKGANDAKIDTKSAAALSWDIISGEENQNEK